MSTALPGVDVEHAGLSTELLFQGIAALVALLGIYLAYLFFVQRPWYSRELAASGWGAALHRFWFSGWGFDWLYDRLFVRPFIWLAQVNRNDVIDLLYRGIAWLSLGFYRLLSATQTGQVRWYVMGITLGAVLTLAIVVFL
jgi:NADH-quinone oxidoreductase subunit L